MAVNALTGDVVISSIKITSDSIPPQKAVPFDANRLALAATAHGAIWIGSYFLLDQAWYKNYPREPFHFYNDNREWNQMDKGGHIWTTYQMSRLSTELWNWTGLDRKRAIVYGSLSGMAYQSIIEIQDGFSAGWGFSLGDMAANLIGAATFAAQEIGWNQQRIQVKFSYRNADYPPAYLLRRNELFGTAIANRILKDYNGQTYWLSVNLHSFRQSGKFPSWLNLAAGYSSDLMLGGYVNSWQNDNGEFVHASGIERLRRFYLSPDIDFTKIRTGSKFLKSVFFLLNSVKLPAPTLELNRKGIRFHTVYF